MLADLGSICSERPPSILLCLVIGEAFLWIMLVGQLARLSFEVE